MRSRPTLEQLEGLLDGIRPADAAWCRSRLHAVHARRRQGKPVDRMLQNIVDRATRSAEQVRRRRESTPRPEYPSDLPITARRKDILAAIEAHPVVIVAGETGSGKTTQLPKLCLEAGRGARGLIGCTQPRRIAARAMAARVAEELGVELGGAVGYQVRFRDRSGPHSLIKFMTDGILLAEAVGDRELHAYDTLIIDEAHERSLNIDFLLGYVKRLLERRSDLKVVITSATIDTGKFSRHFGNAPVIEVSGRGHPVDVLYQPLDEEGGAARDRDLYRGIADAVATLSRIDHRGDILVFLSGEREIHEARDTLNRSGLRHTEVLPLYARLSSAEQNRVFHPGPQRRIILTTNVAETSLTVPRIRFVIDSGFARISRYAHRSRIQRLPIEPVSQASANQRMGRCGRLGPGTCIRLYSEADFQSRPQYTEPEILRTSLASVILRMLTMGLGEVETFPFIDPPAPRMIKDACQLLFELGAVDASREPTAVGRQLAGWPLDVRLGRMVLAGAEQGCTEDLLVLAAGLSIQDPRERPLDNQAAADEAHARFADKASDFVALLRLWQYLRGQRRSLSGNRFRKACRREFLNWQRVLEWFDLYQQLRDQAREEGLPLRGGHGEFEAVHKALLTALLSQVGQRHAEDRSYQGTRNRSFHIFPGSGLFGTTPQWLVSAEIVETSKPYARINARIDPAWLEPLAAHLVKRRCFDPHFSRRRGRVMAWEQVSLMGLVIVEKRRVDYARFDAADARRIFIEAALVRGELPSDAAFLRHNRAVREEVERMEHKRRQRDVLVDETALFTFFDARLPNDVHDAQGFGRWLESLDEDGQRRLHLSHDVLMRADAGEAPPDRFPDAIAVGGQRLSLTYRFEPGHPADGVTVTVPLENLNLLDAARTDWLVPGLRREKVMELMRTLPKPLRRAFLPLPQFTEAALAKMPRDTDRPLADWLAETLSRQTGVAVSASDFQPEALPEHLKLRIVVTGADGSVLTEGRDLAALQDEFGGAARRRFMDREGGEHHRDGLMAWNFGAVPERADTASGVTAWPALVDQDTAVGIRLYDTWEEAAVAHVDGVLRLLALTLSDKFGSLRRHHGLSRAAQMAWSTRGELAGLLDDLTWQSLVALAGDEAAGVRDAAAFEHLARATRRRVGPEFQRRAGELGASLEMLARINVALRESQGGMDSPFAQDISEQLEDLLYPGFLRELDPGRLTHYPRYLEAIAQRIERFRLDPQRDARLAEQVAPWWRRYLNALEAGRLYDEPLDRYRWLVEEFRVSVFAQQLGTAEKVSPQRLQAAWQALET